MAKIDKNWTAEKRGMERSFNFITGKKTKIIDIDPSEGELGYTSKDQTIHLAYEHPSMDGLGDNEKTAFRRGVFCHEMLHQVFTNFTALEMALFRLKGPERRILGMICNILEDPAIEYWAPTAVSGPLLKALRFTIAHIYKKSPNIEESETAFGQYVSALIQFGDMGLLKGKFTFPEAKTVFAKTADIFEKGVTEPDAAKRIEIAKNIFEISRPLWADEVEQEKAMQELADMLSELGKSAATGSGRGQNGDPSSISPSKKDKRRKVTIKKVSKEEMEELKKNAGSSSGPIPEDADVTVYVCDEESDEEKEAENNDTSAKISAPSGSEGEEKEKNADEANESAASSGSSAENDDKTEEAKEENSSSGSEGKSSSDNASDESNSEGTNKGDNMDENNDDSESKASGNTKDNPYKPTNLGSAPSRVKPSSSESDEIDDEDEDCHIDNDEYQIDEEDLKRILSEVERDKEEGKKEAEDNIDTTPIPDYDISSTKMPKKSCLNYRVVFDESQRSGLESAYAQTLEKLSVGIHTTTKALKRIFEDDKEEREYRSSGNVSLKRLYSGSITDRIFEKKIAPAEKSDLVVEILVDESGSMGYNNKYIAARECCIALAEIFNKLNVPVYVIGFTADTMGYDVVHSHYITWKNTKEDRLKLMNLSARCDNCDGASIRYATEVLKKKQAKNKLLIVLSDGQPAAYNYSNGNEDTKDAVKAAKKHTSVLGVAVGNSDTETIRFFYEKDFLHVSNVDELFAGIAKTIKKIIKTW